jgi:hypothetical protein
MTKKTITLLAILLLAFATPCFASWNVWPEALIKSTSGHDKIQQGYDPGAYPSTFSIKGAKREYVVFQLAARSSGESMVGFTPSVQSTFTKGSDTIADANIKFYIANYISTVAGSAVYETAGAWPDILVPYKDRFYNETRSGTESGWGQTIAQNVTQPFLVEIYIPVTTVTGVYTGTIRLTSDLGSKDIVVTLTVWNFSLPAQWTLKTCYGTAYFTIDNVGTNGGSTAARLEYDFRMFQQALDHGINLYGASGKYNVNPGTDPPSFVHANFTDASFGFKNFLAGTASQDYFQKPLPIPNAWEIRQDGGTAGFNNSETYLADWGTWIQANGYTTNTLFHGKFVDEPLTPAAVNAYAAEHATRHGGVGEGYPNRPYEWYTASSVTALTLTDFWDDTYGHMSVTAQYFALYRSDGHREDGIKAPINLADWNTRKATYGDQAWIYYAGDNDAGTAWVYAPTYVYRTAASPSIDAYARNNTFPPLSCYFFGATGLHFWAYADGGSTWSNTVDTIWTDTNLFNANGHYAGDSTYIYPGWPSGCDHDIGGTHYIPLESLRLKLFRWGMQVYEYAKLLDSAGKTSIAMAQIANMVTFNNLREDHGSITIGTAAAWEAAREAMGDELNVGTAASQGFTGQGITIQ